VCASYYIDEKAKKNGKQNVSLSCSTGGAAMFGVLLSNNVMTKGHDKMVGFKLAENSPMVRSYTSCCNTILVMGGMPFGRVFNRNCVKRVSDGQPFVPAKGSVVSWMGTFATDQDYAKAAEPKSKMMPLERICGIASIICCPFMHGAGAYSDKNKLSAAERNVPGFHMDAKQVTEVAPPETYVLGGFQVPKAIQKKLDQA